MTCIRHRKTLFTGVFDTVTAHPRQDRVQRTKGMPEEF